jgi:hypothetical protein
MYWGIVMFIFALGTVNLIFFFGKNLEKIIEKIYKLFHTKDTFNYNKIGYFLTAYKGGEYQSTLYFNEELEFTDEILDAFIFNKSERLDKMVEELKRVKKYDDLTNIKLVKVEKKVVIKEYLK